MFLRTLIPAVLLAAAAHSQSVQPATRLHVRIENGAAFKYTSKLSHAAELNFTFEYHYVEGKRVITKSLDRIAQAYGVDGVPAFTVTRFTSSSDGAAKKEVPEFDSGSLSAADVLVANNIGGMGDSTLGAARQEAIRNAIETQGKGYLAFQGSGDNMKDGWPWYTESLHPWKYANHAAKKAVPVYKHLAESKHIVLQNVLEVGTTQARVPDEINAAGDEILSTEAVPTRSVFCEWPNFARDVSRDPLLAETVTPLLKYVATGVTGIGEPFQRKGGNLYSFLRPVGKGTTAYFTGGRDADELTEAKGFDGGVGDFDRFIAQTLFFLAGYDKVACDASCNGLPIVDAENRLTGEIQVTSVGIDPRTGQGIALPQELSIHSAKLGFTSVADAAFEAAVLDPEGRVLLRKSGTGRGTHQFDGADLRPGIYFLKVRVGSRPAHVKRYALLSASL